MNVLTRSIAELSENEKQWEAFNTRGHCAVIAPPGSGKTKLLATRVAYDLHTEVDTPHGIACVTLTNAAVAELRDRLDALEVEPRSTVFVGTVHSFILSQIIRPFAVLYGHPAATYPIATSKQVSQAYSFAISSHYAEEEDTSDVVSTAQRLRKEIASHEEWALAGKVADVATTYLETLNGAGLTDFDQIIAIAVELVRDHAPVRQVLASRFPRVYIDEYQDLAPGLDKVVRSLCLGEDSSCTMFAVGDPDQAIYGFTGTLPHLLAELALVDQVHTVVLTMNYRCGSEIIRYANLLLDEEPDSQHGSVAGSVTASVVEGEAAGQARVVCDEIQLLEQAGVPLHEIAILAAWGNDCSEAARALQDSGIPCFVRTNEYRLTAITILVESAAAWATHGRERSDYRLGHLLDRWRQLMGRRWTFASSVDFVSLLMDASPDAPARDFVGAIKELGLADALDGVSEREDIVELGVMLEQMTSGSLQHMTVREVGDRARKTGRVEITTMTASKGLEFDVVFILCANQGRIPHYKSVNKAAELREDRRKFYVSVTRARSRVAIYYSSYAITTYGTVKRTAPSAFLVRMGLA